MPRGDTNEFGKLASIYIHHHQSYGYYKITKIEINGPSHTASLQTNRSCVVIEQCIEMSSLVHSTRDSPKSQTIDTAQNRLKKEFKSVSQYNGRSIQPQ